MEQIRTSTQVPSRIWNCAVLLTTIAFCITLSTSCGSATPDKSDKYLGTWKCQQSGFDMEQLTIKKIDGKFFIYPDKFYRWDEDNGLTGKTIPAEYDKENDKLKVPSLGPSVDIVYSPMSRNLLVTGLELVKQPD